MSRCGKLEAALGLPDRHVNIALGLDWGAFAGFEACPAFAELSGQSQVLPDGRLLHHLTREQLAIADVFHA